MKKQLHRVSIIQSSKVVVLLYTVLGFLYTVIGIPMFLFAHRPVIRIIGAVYIFGPLWMGIFGFIFFAIGAALYNVAAGFVGGLEFEVRDVP